MTPRYRVFIRVDADAFKAWLGVRNDKDAITEALSLLGLKVSDGFRLEDRMPGVTDIWHSDMVYVSEWGDWSEAAIPKLQDLGLAALLALKASVRVEFQIPETA